MLTPVLDGRGRMLRGAGNNNVTRASYKEQLFSENLA